MKYRIGKNSVQETPIIPLYGPALCTRRFPGPFSDPLAEELLERIVDGLMRLQIVRMDFQEG